MTFIYHNNHVILKNSTFETMSFSILKNSTFETMSDLKETKTVTWNEDGSGWLQVKYESGGGHGSRIYQRDAGILAETGRLASAILKDLAEYIEDPKSLKFSTRNSDLCAIYPPLGEGFGFFYRGKIIKDLQDEILKCLEDGLVEHLKKAIDERDHHLDDNLFFAKLALDGRNYRSGCVICLADKMMGTTCSCGHTEIVVFRPCGHSICVNPCFQDLCKSLHDIELKPKRFRTPDGKTFITPTCVDVTSAKGFDCPTCRTTVTSCFRAEHTYLSQDFLKPLIEKLLIK